MEATSTAPGPAAVRPARGAPGPRPAPPGGVTTVGEAVVRPAPAATEGSRRRPWVLHLSLVVVVWSTWLVLGGERAIEAIQRHAVIAVTMVGGSLVGGGTSEGGGAVAFPIFTKVLHIPAPDARIFTYLIQSVGMVSASLFILYKRVPVERRTLLWGAPAGMLGAVVGVVFLAPFMPAPLIRVYFTVVLTSLALALVVERLRRGGRRREQVPWLGRREVAVVVAAGFLGGVVSGLVGVGENTLMFIVLVLLFRVSEKVSTPTTVILMSAVTVTAAFCHVVVLDDVPAVVVDYWLAAAPVVVVFAPLGALICTWLSAATIRGILVVLIAAELISTVALVPMTPLTASTAAGALVVTTGTCLWFTRCRRYELPAPGPEAAAQRSWSMSA